MSIENEEWYQRGLRAVRRIWGKSRGERIAQSVADLHPGIHEWVMFSFGLYMRPGLDQRTRSLCTIAVLTALDKPDEVKLHVVGALNNGATKEEIAEVILQTALYAGAPPMLHAFNTAKKVFETYQRPADLVQEETTSR